MQFIISIRQIWDRGDKVGASGDKESGGIIF